MEISGLILLNGFYNSGKTNNSDVPQYADTLLPADTLGLPNGNAGGTARQTRLGLTVSDVRALGALVTRARCKWTSSAASRRAAAPAPTRCRASASRACASTGRTWGCSSDRTPWSSPR